MYILYCINIFINSRVIVNGAKCVRHTYPNESGAQSPKHARLHIDISVLLYIIERKKEAKNEKRAPWWISVPFT